MKLKEIAHGKQQEATRRFDQVTYRPHSSIVCNRMESSPPSRGLIVVAYCYFESIVPEGLSLSDAFFLASAAFSLTCIAIIGVGFCAFATVWAIKFLVIGNNFRLRHRGHPQPTRFILHSITDRRSSCRSSWRFRLPIC